MRRGEQHDLFEGGNALSDTVKGGHAEGAHALADGDLAHLAGVGAGDNELADFVGNGHGLDDGQTSGVTRIFAALAAATAIQSDAFKNARINIQVRVHFLRIRHGFLAMRADAAHEALRAGKDDGGRNQKRSDAHVVKTRDGAGGVIAMHGAQNLMAGQGRLDGDLGGFGVADFTDHDNVRVLAEDGTESIGERKADFLFDGNLVDARHLELNGVFHRDDVVHRVVEFVERGVKSGGLAGAGGAGDEDQAVRRIDSLLELLERVGIEAELVDARGEVRFIEHAEHAFLAVNRGEKAHAQVEVLAADLDAHAAVLWEAALGD